VLAPTQPDPETGVPKRPLIGYYRTRKEAEIALAGFNTDPYLIASDITFGRLFEQWIAKKERLGKSAATITSYKAAFKRCARIADKPIRKIKLSDLLEVYTANSDAGKSTVTNIKIVVDGVFELAERFEYINKNYARLVNSDDMIYSVPTEDKHRVFTPEEISAVLTAPRDIYTDCTKILLFTGFRVEELLSMTDTNIHFNEGYFQGGLKTAAGKGRIVPIHHDITGLIAEYLLKKQTEKVFPITAAKLRSEMFSRWNHIPHDTRHTFISRMQTLHADKVTLEMLVGHSAKNVTDKVYTHKGLEELRQCIEILHY
jgi:integrase